MPRAKASIIDRVRADEKQGHHPAPVTPWTIQTGFICAR
jgi:hypothetical protein